jgi:hypothetical protein
MVGYTALAINEPPNRAIVLLLFDFVLYLAFVFGLLSVLGRASRFQQTATALLGVDTLMTLFAIPLLFWGQGESEGNTSPLAAILFLLLFLWSIDVAGHIVSRAMEIGYVSGVLTMVVYVIGWMSLVALLFH